MSSMSGRKERAVDRSSLYAMSASRSAAGWLEGHGPLKRLLWGPSSNQTSPTTSRRAIDDGASVCSLGPTLCPVTGHCSLVARRGKPLALRRGPRSAITPVLFATLPTSKPSFCSRASANAGTILLSGHRCAMASFGSPEGHSLSEGTSARACVTVRCALSSDPMDALLRTRLDSGIRGERFGESPRHAPS